MSYFDILKSIATFELRPNIVGFFLFFFFFVVVVVFFCFRFSTFELRRTIEFKHSKSYPDIRPEAEYRILTFEFLFWHQSWGRISYFDIRSPILTFETEAEYRILTFAILFWHSNWGRISNFDNRNPILRLELSPDFVLWYSKPYFDIWTEAEFHILTFEILL